MFGPIRKMFNEPHEIAAWMVLLGVALAVYAGRAELDWPVVTMTFLGLFTLLGSRRFRGLSFGPDGVEIAGRPANPSSDPKRIAKTAEQPDKQGTDA
jgi:hypothetical protein